MMCNFGALRNISSPVPLCLAPSGWVRGGSFSNFPQPCVKICNLSSRHLVFQMVLGLGVGWVPSIGRWSELPSPAFSFKLQLSCLPTHLSLNLSPFMIKIYLQTIAAIDRWGRIRGVVIGKQVKILIQCWNFESLLSCAVFKHLSCPPDLQNRRHGLVGEDSRLLVGGRMGGVAGSLLLTEEIFRSSFSLHFNI